MQTYLVSYIVLQDRCTYRKHYLSTTNDFSHILRTIVGPRGRLTNLLKEYEYWNYVRVPAEKRSRERVIKRITIQRLPKAHQRVLEKYLWNPPY